MRQHTDFHNSYHMKRISYVVIIGLILAVSPLLIPSEPIVYIAKADTTIAFEKVATSTEEVVERDCSCIVGAREYGVDIPYNTNAWDLHSNSIPQEGALVLFSYPKSDHVAVIVDLDAGDGMMNIYEENFNNPEGGCRQGYRLVAWDDENIRGFWTNPESHVIAKIALQL